MKPDQKTESAAPAADAGRPALLRRRRHPHQPRPGESRGGEASADLDLHRARKRQRHRIRQDFAPLFDSAVTSAQPDAPLGTHVFTALEFTGPERTILRWNVVSLPGELPKHVRYVEERRDRHGRVRDGATSRRSGPGDTPLSQGPAQLFERIEIPPEVSEAIAQMIIPGSSLIISDQGLGDETGEGTDFIVVAR